MSIGVKEGIQDRWLEYCESLFHPSTQYNSWKLKIRGMRHEWMNAAI
jgi:hypothetical protein